MTSAFYEERIEELETQYRLMQERYQILAETTSALLFEYKPDEDKMIFNYNFPNNKSRKVIENYHENIKVSPLVHPGHLGNFIKVLDDASRMPMRGEIEYLSKITSDDFQWHRTYYSSIADKQGKVISVLGRIHNVHQSTTERQEMLHKVETDFVTGLYNEGAAIEKITGWLKKNPTREAHLVMLELNNFKQINDEHGYAFGDEILKEAAELLRGFFDDDSILARFGGAEFSIFMMDESARGVECRINELVQKIAREITGVERPISCSVGVASRMSKYDSFDDLYNYADNAMQMSKKAKKKRSTADKRK